MQSGLNRRAMRHRAKIGFLLTTGVLFLAGCEQTTRQVQIRPPAATPAPVSASVHEALPFPSRPPNQVFLSRDTRPAIDILVESVEGKLKVGQQEYQEGNASKARVDFNAALDQILASGFSADFDPRLSKLFDETGEAINSYEATATEGTDEGQIVQAPGQPAPIDEIADLTLPAADPRLALKAEKELISVPHDLPLTVNESVLQYLSFFTTTHGRAIVEHGLQRAGRYNDMIRRVLSEEGVPQDLIYLAQAESAFQPQAVSRSGARGIWQFMPFRGEEYDLERSYWVDERSDPEKATHAAARHLRDLYQMFGDWYLVMAAYNSGPLNVSRAVERTGYADFWQLQKNNALPKETQNYVPIIIALALVAKEPAIYGVQVEAEKPAQVEVVKLEHPIDLHLVSDATGADIDNLRLLNPELLRTTTPNEPRFELKIPAGLAARFQENVLQVPEDKWTNWRLHTVADNETLADVARHYHVTVPAIEIANHLEAHSTVPVGFMLNVPTVPPTVKLVRYRVQRGDTLDGIADRFDVSVAQLKRWNHIAGAHVTRGVQLRIYAGGEPKDGGSGAESKPAQTAAKPSVRGVSTRPEAQEALQHRVQAGETLYSIARTYGTTVSSLRQSNPFLADRSLEAGDVLTIQR
jgi:membrane-bound lytic murein transglycosylase D